jgi:hypothetical protein
MNKTELSSQHACFWIWAVSVRSVIEITIFVLTCYIHVMCMLHPIREITKFLS